MRPLIVSQHPSVNVTVVELHGEHDLMNVHEAQAAINEELSAGRGIVVDVSNAAFIDASVLGVITLAHTSAREAGVGFALQYGTTRVVSRIFKVTGLLEQLPCASTRGQALELASSNLPSA
jgi:anti-anti-sigma factor